MVVLASIYIPGALSQWPPGPIDADYVTDKRIMLSSGAKGVADTTQNFVEAINPTTGSATFIIKGDGMMVFSNGSIVKPEINTQRLTVSGTLYADNLAGNQLNVSNTGNFGGDVTALNLVRGEVPPTIDTPGSVGGLYQDSTNGQVYVRRDNLDWENLVPDGYPTGTIMASVLPPSHTWFHGLWFCCDGRLISRVEAADLWDVMVDWRVGDTQMRLPDLQERVLMGASKNYPLGSLGGSNSHLLDTRHLPKHTHTVNIAPDGAHNHEGTAALGGKHTHTVNDRKHDHVPDWYYAHYPPYIDPRSEPDNKFMSMIWNGHFGVMGRWKTLLLDKWAQDVGIFPPEHKGEKGTALDITPMTHEPSALSVAEEKDHDHTVGTDTYEAHSHNVTVSIEGVQDTVDNRQQFMTINYFIKN